MASDGRTASLLIPLIRHPLFLFAVAGIAVRLLMAPFLGVGYDLNFWAVIIRNLETGEGLYGLEGYYYTPVWGYVLSFLAMLQEAFLGIDVMGLRMPEAFMVETFPEWFFTATITSVEFNFWIKIPLMICDLLVGYLIYWLIKNKTGDRKKAARGFALWFLCPLVICVTSISAMFDTFSVLFTLLCIIMIRKDKLFLAGVLLSFAVLTKFFPAYFIFIMIAYIVVMHRGDGTVKKALLTAAAGAILAFIILMLPQILEGSLAESLLFITTRAGGGSGSIIGTLMSGGALALYFIAGVAAVFLGYRLSKKDRTELDDSFFKYLLIMAAVVFIYPPTPQYLVLLIPFLAIHIVTKAPQLKRSWLIISIGGMLFILSGNFILLLSLGTFTDILSLDYVMGMVELFLDPAFADLSPRFIIYYSMGMVEYIGVLTVVAFFFRQWYVSRKNKDAVPEPM